jgi:hypothetical protein
MHSHKVFKLIFVTKLHHISILLQFYISCNKWHNLKHVCTFITNCNLCSTSGATQKPEYLKCALSSRKLKAPGKGEEGSVFDKAT